MREDGIVADLRVVSHRGLNLAKTGSEHVSRVPLRSENATTNQVAENITGRRVRSLSVFRSSRRRSGGMIGVGGVGGGES